MPGTCERPLMIVVGTAFAVDVSQSSVAGALSSIFRSGVCPDDISSMFSVSLFATGAGIVKLSMSSFFGSAI